MLRIKKGRNGMTVESDDEACGLEHSFIHKNANFVRNYMDNVGIDEIKGRDLNDVENRLEDLKAQKYGKPHPAGRYTQGLFSW